MENEEGVNWPAILSRFEVRWYWPIRIQHYGTHLIWWMYMRDVSDGVWRWLCSSPEPIPTNLKLDGEVFAWLGHKTDELIAHERREYTFIDGVKISLPHQLS